MGKIDIHTWKNFALSELFTIVKGKRLRREDMIEGETRFIGASAFNNGITGHVANKGFIHPGGTISVTYNGSIGFAFYQDQEYWASDDVNVLKPKFPMSKNIALFLTALIKIVGTRYVYEDKWELDEMRKSEIYLPVTIEGKPDWEHIEKYMEDIDKKVQVSLRYLLEIVGE